MKTLAELNSTGTTTWERDNHIIHGEYAIIGWGKTHLGRIETIGSRLFSAFPLCNTNGQYRGYGPRKELDTKDVTCLSCRKRLEASPNFL